MHHWTHVFCSEWPGGSCLFSQQQRRNLKADNPPLYFPSSYKKWFQIDELDMPMCWCAEVLGRLNRGLPLWFVTYRMPFAKKWLLDNLEKFPLKMRVGEKISVEFRSFCFITILRMWISLLRRENFSVRGGISGHLFIRFWTSIIEFFGDDVESIGLWSRLPAFGAVDESHYSCAERAEKLLEKVVSSFFLISSLRPAVVWFQRYECPLSLSGTAI